ncbi:MAG: hypothetical protein M0036_00885 [Desulfobacteraceae bacterium]|nr:hypothetical protein [Desulfobacteraceae bacterium]
MDRKRTYTCAHCKGQTEVSAKAAAPQCCGQPMVEAPEPLKQCTLSGTAEHSRFEDDMGEPCDDGRAG